MAHTTMDGRFFALEGTDASGKTTQLELLAKRLSSEGYDVTTFDFPRYGHESSYFVREYLAGSYGTADQVGPYTTSLYYALDRFAAKDTIERALHSGKIVLSNRYAGSNMAHQGTKFLHPEERRGFFIWLDNLEFQMLKIPRPNASFVLRVDPPTMKRLLIKRINEDPDHKTDIHEEDMSHLERAVEVYDDLCALFPKDFTRIDCVRSSRLMKPEAIHEILWQTIEHRLPPPAKKAGTITQDEPDEFTKNPKAQPSAETSQPIKPVSALASLLIQSRNEEMPKSRTSPMTLQFKNTKSPEYYIPTYINKSTRKQYIEIHDKLMGLYSSMAKKLTSHARSLQKNISAQDAEKQALTALVAVLPASTYVDINTPQQTFTAENLIVDLLANSLPEAQESGQEIFRSARDTVGSLFKESDIAAVTIKHQAKQNTRMKHLAEDMLPTTHVASTDAVTLTSFWPRNEFELLPDMLYEHSNMSLKDIQAAIDTWTYDEKEKVMSTYVHSESEPPGETLSALEKATYSWDLLTDLPTFYGLQNHVKAEAVAWQELTPRYGYEVPEIIQDADLTDQFEDCFDLSLKLHGILLAAGYEQEAQYATLLGHKLRWKMKVSAAELSKIYAKETSNDPSKAVTQSLHEKQLQKHPILTAALAPSPLSRRQTIV